MSSNQGFVCQHCGRSDFKSKQGLQYHLKHSRSCNPSARAAREQLDAQVADVDVSMDQSDDHESSSEDDIIMQADDHEELSVVQVIELQDEEDWGVGWNRDQRAKEPQGPAAEHLLNFRDHVRQVRDNMLPFNEDEEAAVCLMDTLHKKGSTLESYEGVMCWHLQHSGEYGPKRFISREKILTKLRKRYNMPENVIKKRTITLPHSKAKVKIVSYDARDQVTSLLTDPRFLDNDFLHFDGNPLASPPDLDYYADLNTGLSYKETYKKLITNPQKQMLMPIIFYIDGAVTGQFDKLQVESLKMTLGIFNRQARDREYAWRVLGYDPNYTPAETKGDVILEQSGHSALYSLHRTLGQDDDDSLPDLYDEDEDNSEANANDNEQEGGLTYDSEGDYELIDTKAQDFHRILAAILKSYRAMEKDGMVWDYKYRGKIYKNVELVFFVAFVKCDTAEADKLCGHYESRSKGIQQLCWYCTTKNQDTDKIDPCYVMKTQPMIKRLVEKNDEEALKRLSQQNIKNAFYDIRMGQHSDQGIHGACPMELLHDLLLGVFKYMRDCFLIQIGLTAKVASDINALAKLLGKIFARQSERDRPKTNFAKGIFAGKIMGKEFLGVLLLIAAILQTEKGKQLLNSVRGGNFKEDFQRNDWALLVESLLQWEAYLKQDQMEHRHVVRLKKKHQFLMFVLKRIFRRTAGMGLKLVKFHAILHLVQDIVNYGVPNVVDTGSNESHHKVTKKVAKLTQKNIPVFKKQTAVRLDEFHLVDLAICELEGRNHWEYFCLDQERGPLEPCQAPQNNEVPDTTGTSITVFFNEDAGETCWKFRKNKARARWDGQLVDFLYELQKKTAQTAGIEDLNIRTEHKRAGEIFRGHPDYKKTGQWNDWAMFDWGAGHGKLPGEIWCFVDLSDAPQDFSVMYADCNLRRGVYAVVESSTYCPNTQTIIDPNDKRRVHKRNKRRLMVQINISELFVPLIKELAPAANYREVIADQKRFFLADVESIVSPLMVIPDIGSDNKHRYFHVLARNEWVQKFQLWVEQAHTHDVENMDSNMDNQDEELHR